LGYKSEAVIAYLDEAYPTLDYQYVVEDEPLGTGGAIHFALQKAVTENVLVTNGDTLFKIKLDEMKTLHQQQAADCTLALKPMQDFDRYGVVTVNDQKKITSFKEKQYYQHGLINGGVYLLNKTSFLQHIFPPVFSFEKDYLEKFTTTSNFFGSVQNGYFIDIGIPEDFEKAQSDLEQKKLDLSEVDASWTFFIDRDGVINDEIVGNYVLNKDEFKFSSGVLEAMSFLTQKVNRIIVISNQRGIGRGLMTEQDLQSIHEYMLEMITTHGGRIDQIIYCTEKDSTAFHRKPNPGMALQAIKRFPDIDLAKTIMIGNKPSDMRFGRAAGVHTVFLTTTNKNEPYPHPDVDLQFDSLLDFALALQS
jgi:D-glycero-alpha-D-manno-heptose 1-phosphate guanylyltransferase